MKKRSFKPGQRYVSKSETTHPQFVVVSIANGILTCNFLYQSGEIQTSTLTPEEIEAGGYRLASIPRKAAKKPSPGKVTETHFATESCSGTHGWEDLVTSGRANVDDLEDGQLKKNIQEYLRLSSWIDKRLYELGYEPS